MKECIRCDAILPLEQFYSDKSKKDGKTPYCKKCRQDKAKTQNDKDPQKARDRAAALRRKKGFAMDLARMGLSEEQYSRMVEAQNGRCAICRENESMLLPSGEVRRLSIDHDHACCPTKRDICGKCNRGLLCNRCNRMLGMVKDDLDLLISAVAYLEEYSSE